MQARWLPLPKLHPRGSEPEAAPAIPNNDDTTQKRGLTYVLSFWETRYGVSIVKTFIYRSTMTATDDPKWAKGILFN